MEEIVGKQIDPSASGGAVANNPPKLRNPPIRQRILGQVSQYRLVKEGFVKNTISRPTLNPVSSIGAELAELRRACGKYRTTNSRAAVYLYLEAVFALVMRWRRLNCALNKSRAALRLRPNPPQMKAEPFGIVIFCTADPKIVDAKTRSKWSRVLRYAARAKPPGQRLTDFVKSNGGVNECARKFAQPKRRP
jgi:hypothetical protein